MTVSQHDKVSCTKACGHVGPLLKYQCGQKESDELLFVYIVFGSQKFKSNFSMVYPNRVGVVVVGSF
jgi:hypothetical protein